MSISRAHIQVTESGTTLATKKIAGLGATTKATSSSMGLLSKSVVGLVGAYAGFRALTSTISVVKQFDTTMLEVKAVTQATTETFGELSSAAREMGATTRFSASEAGTAILALSRAGFTANESIAALPETLNLAIAGVLELGEAADLTSVTIRQFGLQATDAGRVADVIVTTANSAATNVQQLAEAMKYAGATSSAMGFTLEETSAMLGTFANAGIRGSMAGTSFRMMLLQMANPSDNFKEALSEMGLNLSDVDIKSKSLVQVFKTLKNAGMNASQAQRIFGTRAVSAALSTAKLNDNLADLIQLNKDAEGAAKKAAETMDSGLNAAFLRLKSVTEELMLKIGDNGLKGALTGITKVMIFLVEDTNTFITNLNQLGNVVGKWVFVIVESLNELLKMAGSFGFAFAKTFEESFKLIYNTGYDFFENLGKSIFDLIHGGRSAKFTSEIFADNWKSSLKKISKTWDEELGYMKKNWKNIGDTYNDIDFFEAYKLKTKKAVEDTKSASTEINTALSSAYSGTFGDLNDTDIISSQSLIPKEVIDNTVTELETFAQKNKDIMDIVSTDISKALGDVFTNTKTSFASFLDSMTSSIIRMMTNKMVTQFFTMLSGLGSGESSNIPAFGSASGGFASTFGSGVIGQFAFGGNYSSGSPKMINEYGPGEIDVPSYDGRVLSRNDAMKAVQGNETKTNVKIVNVYDNNQLLEAMKSVDGERIIVNYQNKHSGGR